MIKFEYLQMTLDTDSVPTLERELALNGWILQSRDTNDYTTSVTFTRPMFTRPLISVFDFVDADSGTQVTKALPEVPTIEEMQAIDDVTEPYEGAA